MIEKIAYKFKGTSDCELVLALYKCYGLSFLSRLRGEFSLCLYDSTNELFIAVRDRYGIKPLFWTVQDGELMMAAEMKAFMPLGWNPQWNVDGIVSDGFQGGSRTIFKNVNKVSVALILLSVLISKVRAGHYLICRDGVQERQYWDMEYPSKVGRESLKRTMLME